MNLKSSKTRTLPRGIVSVVQTAFDDDLRLDLAATRRLVDAAIAAGVDGFLVPAVASEVEFLSADERREVVITVCGCTANRVPVILGASAETPAECGARAALAAELGLAGCLVAIPPRLYADAAELEAFFGELAPLLSVPLILQDLQFHGPGLPIEQILRLRRILPQLVGLKIETVPSGPKYTAVRNACGGDFWIAGGWAVAQMIEALDRGVDAMVPESAMVPVYRAIMRFHRRGERERAMALFRELLPVVAFTNQDIATSVAFFKRLLVRKGIFATAAQRLPLPAWDAVSERVADALIDEYLGLESRLAAGEYDGR